MKNKRPIIYDYYFSRFRWYRKLRKAMWYKHEFSQKALQLSITLQGTFWALYDDINEYSYVIDKEDYR